MAVLPVGQEPAHYGRPSLLPVTTSHHIFTAVTFNLALGAAHLRGGYGLDTVGTWSQEDCHIDVDIDTEPPTPPQQGRPERLASSSLACSQQSSARHRQKV